MRSAFLAVAVAMVLPAHADEIGDTIRSALEAWEAGDRQYALEELGVAQQLIQAAKADSLAGFLPPAPAGWTRTINSDGNPAMVMFGVGSTAEGVYAGPEGEFRITLMADNPLVAQLAGVLGNSALLAQMGKTVRIGRVRFLQRDNEMQGLVGNRIMIQAQDMAPEVMTPVLEQIDFAALEKWSG